ncbi:interferon alpha/beta receptor 2-like [Chaetodon trifascialis]|uniref:interferon alpha/beta receptor 2-like n=1 Tax=Chaetodon trifascialis TaxID=109706 RepID=UPI003991C3C9
MTALICLLAWLPQVLPDLNKLPQPVNVTLTSSQFNHTLNWEPGPGTPAGVHYAIAMSTETWPSWLPVAGCERVQHPLVCDLTRAFSDLHQTYSTQITAQLEAQASQPVLYEGFQPIRDTHLDPPLLTVTACGTNLCVDFQPPVEHLRQIYESLQYTLRIQPNGGEGTQVMHFLEREVLKDLGPGRQYCVSVCFSDPVLPRKSNYSQPVCAFTAGGHSAGTDPAIAAVLCVLVLLAVVTALLLVAAGYICLRRRPLPLVLTSIRHLEDVVVLAPHSTSLLSLLNVKPTPPSAGEKRSSQTSSDESDGEVGTEDAGGSSGGAYKLRVGLNLLSSSSSSSSLSAPLSPEPKPEPSSSEVFDPPPAVLNSAETRTQKDEPSPESGRRASGPPADSDCPTAGAVKPNKEEVEAVGGEDNQDVNLLTLTFGRHEEEMQEEEESHADMAEMHITTQTLDSQKVPTEAASCPDNEEEEEEEEEEDSGYIGRPCPRSLKKLL